MGLSRPVHRLRSVVACGVLLAACGGTAPGAGPPSPSLEAGDTTTVPLRAERPAACRPDLLDPEAVGPPSSAASVVGGPFGFTAPGWPGWDVLGHRFEDGRSAAPVRFGCPVGALVDGERVVSVWCEPGSWDSPDPGDAWCSLEVHGLPDLVLASAFDVPLELELVGVAGDRLLFGGPASGVGAPRIVATDPEGVERWSASPEGRPEFVCIAGTIVVAAQGWLGPDTPVGVETFDLGTGRSVASGDVDGSVVGCNEVGVWVLDPVTTAAYGADRAGNDGSLRVLDPATLQERARSGPGLTGIRSATVDTSGVVVQEHTVDGRIALGWIASATVVAGTVPAPAPVADLALADGGRSGSVPWRVVGHGEDGLWIAELGVLPLTGTEP